MRNLKRPTGGQPIRVVVVNDDPVQCRAEADGLMHAGYQVEAMTNPSALSERADFPDLFLLNLHQRPEQALAVARGIRQRSRQVGVLIVTASDSGPVKINALNSGADNCIARPYRLEEMLAMLDSLSRRL